MSFLRNVVVPAKAGTGIHLLFLLFYSFSAFSAVSLFMSQLFAGHIGVGDPNWLLQPLTDVDKFWRLESDIDIRN